MVARSTFPIRVSTNTPSVDSMFVVANVAPASDDEVCEEQDKKMVDYLSTIEKVEVNAIYFLLTIKGLEMIQQWLSLTLLLKVWSFKSLRIPSII